MNPVCVYFRFFPVGAFFDTCFDFPARIRLLSLCFFEVLMFPAAFFAFCNKRRCLSAPVVDLTLRNAGEDFGRTRGAETPRPSFVFGIGGFPLRRERGRSLSLEFGRLLALPPDLEFGRLEDFCREALDFPLELGRLAGLSVFCRDAGRLFGVPFFEPFSLELGRLRRPELLLEDPEAVWPVLAPFPLRAFPFEWLCTGWLLGRDGGRFRTGS